MKNELSDLIGQNIKAVRSSETQRGEFTHIEIECNDSTLSIDFEGREIKIKTLDAERRFRFARAFCADL